MHVHFVCVVCNTLYVHDEQCTVHVLSYKGDIMTTEVAVDSAKEELKRAKEKQTELSDQLTTAIDEARNDGATEQVEMVSDTVFICMCN